MSNKYRKMWSKEKAFFFSCIGILLVIIAILGIRSLIAKYQDKESKTDAVQTEEFYFTSNCLSENGETITLAADTSQINIELRNYADDLRYSPKTIQYTYDVKKENDAQSIAEGTGEITGGEKNTSNLAINNLENGTTYKVTVTSTDPFHSVLKGTFKIVEKNTEIHYAVTDTAGSAYVLVQVDVEAYDGKAKLEWPEGIIPDSTDSTFSGITTWENNKYSSGNVKVSLKPYSSYTYRFFKENVSKLYNKENIKVTKEK